MAPTSHKPATTALIQPLAWEFSCAALKRQKKNIDSTYMYTHKHTCPLDDNFLLYIQMWTQLFFQVCYANEIQSWSNDLDGPWNSFLCG